ncbi:Protein of unknown function (DUF1257) [Rivularia sp. PCC 7116]|uniref:DUF1257 domain-containing protein n=1 Tax=Rivularia sp. PCC 7116 TaxID=373994 RepID=UPI00029F49BB|nr:DUF1257 domain-containing protein [Rivularia sp. PCC 7116]AFY57556.1 Protein of unknown function (DUF1257) [Rivularia sp. PCC 7116]
MSHFTAIKTQIKDRDALVKALADVGFKNIEVHETAESLYGYQGDVRAETAEVIIRRKYVGSYSNDIGFKLQEDGQYQAIISEFDRGRYNQQWLGKVMQRYGYYSLMASAQEQGFTVEEDEVMEDGTVRVVVARWS